MKAEIIFHTAGRPKVHDNIYSIYTKGDMLCVHLENDLIIKYPLCNVFSVAHKHAPHLGTTRDAKDTPSESVKRICSGKFQVAIEGDIVSGIEDQQAFKITNLHCTAVDSNGASIPFYKTTIKKICDSAEVDKL